MACAHPFGIEPIRNEAGEVIGGRCPACGSVAYKGESFWRQLARNLPVLWGGRPKERA